MIEQIKSKKINTLLFELIPAGNILDGSLFIKDPSDDFQVNLFKFNKNKKVEPHYHEVLNDKKNKNHHYIEVWFIQGGSLLVNLFDITGEILKSNIQLNIGDVLITYENGAHEILINSDASILELKYILGAGSTTRKFTPL